MATCADLEGRGLSRGPGPFCKIHISLNYIVELPKYASAPLANSNNRRTLNHHFFDPRMLPFLKTQNYSSKPPVKFPGSPHTY